MSFRQLHKIFFNIYNFFIQLYKLYWLKNFLFWCYVYLPYFKIYYWCNHLNSTNPMFLCCIIHSSFFIFLSLKFYSQFIFNYFFISTFFKLILSQFDNYFSLTFLTNYRVINNILFCSNFFNLSFFDYYFFSIFLIKLPISFLSL